MFNILFRYIGVKGLNKPLIFIDSLRYIPLNISNYFRRYTVKEIVLYIVLIGVGKGWLYSGGGGGGAL